MIHDAARQRLAREAKAIVALAFRNGPIEDVHAGERCPTCAGKSEFSRITDAEMKAIIKRAVDKVFELLCLQREDSEEYDARIAFGSRCTAAWDDPAEVPAHASLDEEAHAVMREVNRSAVIVIPQQPFLDWLHATDPTSSDITLNDLAKEPDIYLLPECESDADFEHWLRELSPAIFECLLGDWWRDEEASPEPRTFTMFRTWFETRYHSLVLDLSEEPLEYMD